MNPHVISTSPDSHGGTTLATVFANQPVELVYVHPVGTLELGEDFLGRFSPDWVPTLCEALKMARDLAERTEKAPEGGRKDQT
jgi:hypothetical protein